MILQFMILAVRFYAVGLFNAVIFLTKILLKPQWIRPQIIFITCIVLHFLAFLVSSLTLGSGIHSDLLVR